MIKKVGKNQKNLSDEARQFGVILEDIDSKLNLVVEGQFGLDKKIDKNHQEFKEFREEVNYKFKVVNDVLDSHGKILNSHTKTLASHTEMIGSIKVDVEIIKTDIEFIKSGFKKKVDLEEFESLEKRVIRLESLLQFQK